MTRLFCIDTAGGWCLVFVCFSLLLCSMSSAIVRHNDTPFSDHPSDAVIGKWNPDASASASCVAIGKRYVISTKHQPGGGVGINIILDGTNYIAVQELTVATDIRVVRITNSSGGLANLSQFSDLYSGSYPISNTPIRLGGFGDIRGAELRDSSDNLYGYKWASNPDSTTPVWCTNKTEFDFLSLLQDDNLLKADFDGPTSSTEGALADHDSGGGWFISDGVWKLVGLTYGVDIESGNLRQSCFLGQQSYFLAHWLNNYVNTIQGAINASNTVPTGISAAAGYNCGEILLSWNGVSGVDGYRVYYSQGSAEFVLHSSVLSTQTSRTIGSLSPNEAYNFAVTAYKGIAESDYSSIVAATASTNCQYQISGYVMDSGNPIQDVIVDANNGATTSITDSQGYYSISVPYGWSGSITPSKFGYSFTPQSLTYSTAVITNLTGQNFEANAPILIDDFNDNTRSADWIVQNSDFPTTIIDETNQRLEISSSNDINPTEAFYSANGWKISSEQNFSLKIEFHNEILTQSFTGVAIRLVDSNVRENHIQLSAASEANQPIFAVQAGINGMLIDRSVPRTSSDGSLWISYNSDTNEIYLSLNGFGPEDYFQVVSLPEKIDWIIELAGFTENFGFASGLAWFDNFTIQTGKLTNWPPKTDINRDGFIDIEDLCEMAGQWLNTGGGFSADIDSDGYVDFVDLARLAEVW